MEQIRDMMFTINGKIGEIAGQMASIVREMTALGARMEQHLEDDRRHHADQDSRLISAIGNLTGAQTETTHQLTESQTQAFRELDQRLRKLEAADSGRSGAQLASTRWMAAILTVASMVSGLLGGLVSHWIQR